MKYVAFLPIHLIYFALFIPAYGCDDHALKCEQKTSLDTLVFGQTDTNYYFNASN